jgi:hypothetical protein
MSIVFIVLFLLRASCLTCIQQHLACPAWHTHHLVAWPIGLLQHINGLLVCTQLQCSSSSSSSSSSIRTAVGCTLTLHCSLVRPSHTSKVMLLQQSFYLRPGCCSDLATHSWLLTHNKST